MTPAFRALAAQLIEAVHDAAASGLITRDMIRLADDLARRLPKEPETPAPADNS